MLKNYLKIAFRNLNRHKLFSFITLGGLTIGIWACMVILVYVSFELSYDRFHKNNEDIYRIRLDQYNEDGNAGRRAKTFGFVKPALDETFPEVQASARLINLQGIMGNFVMNYQDASFTEENMFYADASIFSIFSFKMLEGDPEQALVRPHTAVITASTAQKYFGEETPVGKSIIMNGDEAYVVTGVLQDVPPNSHLKFDFLLSFETLKGEDYMLGWADFLTYVLLTPGTDPDEFNEKLNTADLIAQRLGQPADAVSRLQLSLQPLTDIHLHSHLEGEVEVNGSAVSTYGLMFIAFLILLIGWINYINLSTTRALDRAREVGIRKVVGAQRASLIRQFMLESGLLNVIAALFAFLLAMETLPLFSRLIGKPLVMSTFGRVEIWVGFLAILLIGGMLSSFYPAFVLSSFRPVKIMKGELRVGKQKMTLRKALVIYQFVTSIILITGTLAVFQQLSFMRNKELGIDVAHTLVVKAPSISDSTYVNRLSSFKTELLRQTAVQSITSSSNIPGRESTWGSSVMREGDDPDHMVEADLIGVDYDYIDSYGLKLLAGRKFSQSYASDESAIMLNETALTRLRFDKPDDAIGKRIIAWRGQTFEVVGVLNDHHQLSPQFAHVPLVYFLRPGGGTFYSIKLQSRRISDTIDMVQAEYTSHFPGNPFEYFFLDDYFDQQYREDLRFGNIFGLFTGLAVFIACLGLFALASYAAIKRTKEIGIRKVLGASVPNLVALLSREFLTLAGIATIIAVPISAGVINKWLENYAFKISLGWELFALPVLIIALLVGMTVTFQALKTTMTNPVDSLRYE